LGTWIAFYMECNVIRHFRYWANCISQRQFQNKCSWICWIKINILQSKFQSLSWVQSPVMRLHLSAWTNKLFLSVQSVGTLLHKLKFTLPPALFVITNDLITIIIILRIKGVHWIQVVIVVINSNETVSFVICMNGFVRRSVSINVYYSSDYSLIVLL